MNFPFFDKYLNYSIERKRQSNFDRYFSNKYKDTYTDESLEEEAYNKIKNFFLKFNYDSSIKTFSENIYKKSDFNFLRIIIKEDLEWAKYLNDNLDNQDISNLKKSYNENILKISLSPSSPYLPINTSRFSIAGVSKGSNPYSSKTDFIVLKIWLRLRTILALKSLVPCGNDGLDII